MSSVGQLGLNSVSFIYNLVLQRYCVPAECMAGDSEHCENHLQDFSIFA